MNGCQPLFINAAKFDTKLFRRFWQRMFNKTFIGIISFYSHIDIIFLKAASVWLLYTRNRVQTNLLFKIHKINTELQV